MMDEPYITINGTPLTIGQAMTVRVALSDFAITLEGGLGDDAQGRELAKAYRERLVEIFKLIDPRDHSGLSTTPPTTPKP
jgi:hypothetical protein